VSRDFHRVQKGITLTGLTTDPVTEVEAGDIYFNETLQSFRGYSNGSWGSLGGGTTLDRVTQAHGFAVGDLLYLNGSTYALAKADASATSEVVGMVSRIIDGNTFELTTDGEVSGLTGLTAGAVYFLSESSAGDYTTTEPSVLGQVSLPVGVASSTTSMYVSVKRGVVVGGVNLRTNIALANNAVSNIQLISAYNAGEIAGWVFIDGSTNYRFYVSVPFAKKGDDTDYYVSPTYMGDTPPVGFSITVTSGGQVQVTMPNIPVYVGAYIDFAINAPAVGATLPLSIDSTLVNFTILKAKDSSGFVFQENGGTQIGSISDNSDFVFGKTAGGNAHTMYGRDGDPTGYQHTLNIRSSSAANSIFLNLGIYETGDYAWIQSLESDTGNPKPLKFFTGSTQAGEYSTTSAWTFGNTGSTATHITNGAQLRITDSSTVNGNTTLELRALDGSSIARTASITMDAASNANQGLYITASVGKLWFYNGAVNSAQVATTGAWTLGPSGNTSLLHEVNGNALRLRTNGSLRLMDGANSNWTDLYTSTASGAATLTIAPGGGSAKGTVTEAGAWTLGPSSTQLVHTINGAISFGYENSTFPSNAHIWRDTSDQMRFNATGGYVFSNDGNTTNYGTISTSGWNIGGAPASINTNDSTCYGLLRVEGNNPAATNGQLRVLRSSSTATNYLFNCASDVGGPNTVVFRVECDGDVVSATNSYTSDERAKKDIIPIQYGLNEILQLNPISFRWNHEDALETKSFSVATAQEVQAIMPEMVRDDGLECLNANGQTFQAKSLYAGEIMAVMVKAIQELKAKNDELEARIAILEA
jgi:hypothetical protein